MPKLDVPVSVFDYVHSPDIAAAVHAVLAADQDLVDPSLGWGEMRAYHQALLMACKLRSDLACHLMDCWEAIWGEAIGGARFKEVRQDDRNVGREERYAPRPDLEIYDGPSLFLGSWFKERCHRLDESPLPPGQPYL